MCIKTVANGSNYISKGFQEGLVIDTNTTEHTDLKKLTLTEQKIIELIRQQKTSKQIGDMLFVSEKQIEKYRSNIIEKLGLPKEKNVLLVWAIKNV